MIIIDAYRVISYSLNSGGRMPNKCGVHRMTFLIDAPLKSQSGSYAASAGNSTFGCASFKGVI